MASILHNHDCPTLLVGGAAFQDEYREFLKRYDVGYLWD
jgi:hypothetical protein